METANKAEKHLVEGGRNVVTDYEATVVNDIDNKTLSFHVGRCALFNFVVWNEDRDMREGWGKVS
jgi:hypothetical protein